MTELTFSITPTDAIETAALQRVLKEFESRTRINVQLHEIDTKSAREAITQFAVTGKGPDVSQIGSSWLRGIVDMNVLCPFTARDIAQIGTPADFIEASWTSTFIPGQPSVQWAIPWLADVRMVCYRTDLLKNAGIEEQGAFATPEAFDRTLRQLQSSGVPIPWVVPTKHSWRTLHNIASWVWGAGGEFVDSDGKQPMFDRLEALTGIKAYFALGRYLMGHARGLTTSQSDVLFMSGQAAATISGPHLLAMSPELLDRVGFTSPPGPPFVGGSHLVIWKYTRHEDEAVKLVQALTNIAAQKSYGLGSLLPVSVDALSEIGTLDGQKGAFARYVQRAQVAGRSFWPVHLWNIVEANLVEAMASIWDEILRSPVPDLDRILQRTLSTLAYRLTMSLNSE
ncbi:MAG: extracellular solute-binding protein [Chloroflexota bacterium]